MSSGKDTIDSGSRYKSGEKVKRCSVASPEATKRLGLKTWGKSQSLRLKGFDYSSPWIVYHITIRSSRKKKVFCNSNINRKVVEILKRSVDLYGYRVLSYCLMPDHLHILVQAGGTPKDLRDFVRGFKSFSSKIAKQHLWQRSFYEHILRKEEDVADVAKYIFNNPLRKELVKDCGQYRWCELLLENFSVVSPEAMKKKTSSQE